MLWTTAWGCGALSAAVVVWTLRTPPTVDHATSRTNAGSSDAARVGTKPMDALSVEQLRAAVDVDLRRPLYDAPPPPPPTAAPPPPPPPLDVKLAGTVVEDGHSRAILVDGQGKMAFKRVGERSGEAEVVEIRDGQVTVRYRGEPVVLKLEKPPAPGGGG
jgi:hypothetical protein